MNFRDIERSISTGKMACIAVKRVGLLLGQMTIRSTLITKQAFPSSCILLRSNVSPLSDQQCRGRHKYVENKLNKPLDFSHSGDSKQQEHVDGSEILFKYRNIPDIDSLPDEQKKIFTFEFATSREQLEHRHMLMQNKMRENLGPGPCYEKHIAYLTVKIRNLIPKAVKERPAKLQKVHLLERIAKRNKILGYLRKLDFDRYVWIQTELGIKYFPYDKYKYHRKRANAPLKKAAREECREMILEKYKECAVEFEKELIKVKREKERLLEDIDRLQLDREKIIAQFLKDVDEKNKVLVQKRLSPKMREFEEEKQRKKLEEYHAV